MMKKELPGKSSHEEMMVRPKQKFMKTKNPISAAVLILLYPLGNNWYFYLTKRSKTVEHHKGQISLPGGMLEKGESKIVRMAFDLPNGSALSVRIEQTPSNLSISFITQDAETQEVIQFIQELTGREQNKSHSSSISVYLFQSYQDMDSYFKQAA
mgnify:CR=1 FL=1